MIAKILAAPLLILFYPGWIVYKNNERHNYYQGEGGAFGLFLITMIVVPTVFWARVSLVIALVLALWL